MHGVLKIKGQILKPCRKMFCFKEKKWNVNILLVQMMCKHKGNNKITDHRAIFQRERQNS